MASYHVTDPARGLTPEELAAELRCFRKHFPKKRLLAIQLDGFSHRVIYDDIPREGKAHAVSVSFCCSEAEWLAGLTEEEREDAKAARAFLTDIGYTSHSWYQGNPTEVIYVMPEER